MKKMTEENLQAAVAGESQAHVKYAVFADVADKEGKPNIARFFRAISHAELIHSRRHMTVLGAIGDTKANLATALGGEGFEVDEMYPAYRAVAELQQESGALGSINAAFKAEIVHRGIYEASLAAAKDGKDVKAQDIYICPVCGWTALDGAPDTCPICGAKKELFVKY